MHEISDFAADSSNRSTSKVSIAMPVSVEKADRPKMLIPSEASVFVIAERLPRLSTNTHKSSMHGWALRGKQRGCHESSTVVVLLTNLWTSSLASISRSCTLVGVRIGWGRCSSGAGLLSKDLWVLSSVKGALAVEVEPSEVDWGCGPSGGLPGSSQDDLRLVVGMTLADSVETVQGTWARSLAPRSLTSSSTCDLLNVFSSTASIEVGPTSGATRGQKLTQDRPVSLGRHNSSFRNQPTTRQTCRLI